MKKIQKENFTRIMSDQRMCGHEIIINLYLTNPVAETLISAKIDEAVKPQIRDQLKCVLNKAIYLVKVAP